MTDFTADAESLSQTQSEPKLPMPWWGKAIVGVVFVGTCAVCKISCDAREDRLWHEFYENKKMHKVLAPDGTLDPDRTTVTMPYREAERLRHEIQN